MVRYKSLHSSQGYDRSNLEPPLNPQVTSDVLFHVRTADGVSLDLTADEAAARKYAREMGAQLWRLVRSAGSQTRVAT